MTQNINFLTPKGIQNLNTKSDQVLILQLVQLDEEKNFIKAVLSDGFSKQNIQIHNVDLKNQIQTNKISLYDVVVIFKYTRKVNNKPIIIIEEMQSLYSKINFMIGRPKEQKRNQKQTQYRNQSENFIHEDHRTIVNQFTIQRLQEFKQEHIQSNPNEPEISSYISPKKNNQEEIYGTQIKDLQVGKHLGNLLCFIVSKTEIFYNIIGKHFLFQIQDSTGTIDANVFEYSKVDSFHNILQVNNYYSFSNFTVYQKLSQNQLEIQLINGTLINEVSAINFQSAQFTAKKELSEDKNLLPKYKKQQNCKVLEQDSEICIFEPLKVKVIKKNQKNVQKQQVISFSAILQDSDNKQYDICVQGQQQVDKIYSQLQVNNWYKISNYNLTKNYQQQLIKITELTEIEQINYDIVESLPIESLKSLKYIVDQSNENQDLEYLQNYGAKFIIVSIQEEPQSQIFYNSCTHCQQRVTKYSNVLYYCSRCKKSMIQSKLTFLFHAKIKDDSEEIIVQIQDPVASQILGFSADNFQKIFEKNQIQSQKMIEDTYNQEICANFMIKSQIFNNVKQITYKVKNLFKNEIQQEIQIYQNQFEQFEESK